MSTSLAWLAASNVRVDRRGEHQAYPECAQGVP
jgi:hypothetical protein